MTHRKAFSLIELLVVTAILSLLIAVLVPALGRAREQGKSTVCLSNLRQLATAAVAYTTDNGTYPASSYQIQNGTVAYDYNWDYTFVTGQPAPLTGLLFQGDSKARVQQCPSWAGRNFFNPPFQSTPYTGYNYNVSYVGGEPQQGMPGSPGYIACTPLTPVDLRNPVGTVCFGDAQNNANFCNTYMRSPLPSPSEIQNLAPSTNPGLSWAAADDPAGGQARRAGAQGFRHLGKTNASFADGHAESVSDRFSPIPLSTDIGFIGSTNASYGGQP